MNKVFCTIVILNICLFIGCEQVKKNKNKSEYSEGTTKDISKAEQQVSEIDSLTYYFKKISSEKVSDADLTRYVYAFPSTFQSFQDYFGFDDEEGEMPLYKEANAYIDMLFLSSEICCKDEVLNKIINIAKQGKWDADAVNYLKHKLHEMIEDNPDDLFEILSQKEQRTQIGFWFFHFDGPHPEKEISQRLLEKITRSRADVNALKKGFNKVLKQGVD
ncbi:hypothetical protein [Sinomicrobium soli]|uniref:hypothetical protein n=1 Tax=Sinomicrobium sp. N-1-3-6 TaxID=2219864 RepID=UPI000DCBDFCF|nr:hypothetical protein [Sinomicrobium sp. N-1-3-6]RAV30768.1 hypothetical protein DN748_00470 [Sinomicrobium sp. N-1-3-6]